MKTNMIFLVVLLFVSSTLYAQKTLTKVVLIDGSEVNYNLEDIAEIDFIKSNMLYMMTIHLKDTTNNYLIVNIKSIEFIDSTEMKINLASSSKNILLNSIDSIIFFSNTCEEVVIGYQTWMCKNLNVDRYRNGELIREVNDSVKWKSLYGPSWCYFKNDPYYGTIYGKLYNWAAVNDSRGLAPAGWHVASSYEWQTLIDYIGGAKNYGKLKATGTLESGDGLWDYPNENATNETNFSAIPGGICNENGKSYLMGYASFWWTSTNINNSFAYFCYFKSINSVIWIDFNEKEIGMAVRCVKDGNPNPPIITSIFPNSVVISELITIKGSNFGSQRGINFVSFNNSIKPKQSDYLKWSDTEIQVKVPEGVVSGQILVNVNKKESNRVDFTVY